MTDRLIAVWARVNAACASPWTALIALLFMTAWFTISAWSNANSPLLVCDGHGRLFGCGWDPGGSFGNDFQNELQLVLLFVACSLGAQAVKHHNLHHARIHELTTQVRRVTTVVLPTLRFAEPWVILHELGHALHETVRWTFRAKPVSTYAENDHHEAFAEAFCAWIAPWYAGKPLVAIDPAAAAFFDALA